MTLGTWVFLFASMGRKIFASPIGKFLLATAMPFTFIYTFNVAGQLATFYCPKILICGLHVGLSFVMSLVNK